MATPYREPGVKVTQEFENALPALATFSLPNVTVGPAYQVAAQKAAGPYDGTTEDYAYPQQILGTYVDTRPADPNDETSYPVKVEMKNVVVRTLTAGTGEVATYDMNQFIDPTVGAFSNVEVGDVIVITSGMNAGSYTVREKLSANNVKTNETFVAAETNVNYEVRRNIQASVGIIEITNFTKDETKVTLPTGLTYTLPPFGACPIVAGDVLISYRALRLEKSAGIAEYKGVAELQADFGLDQIVPENPVVFGAWVALNNSVTATNILALPQDYITLNDELIAYGKSFDILAQTEMYAISTMTQNPAVATLLKTHVEGYSQPDNKLERVGIFNRRLVTKMVVLDERETSLTDGISGTPGAYTTFEDSTGTFITDGVVPGMFLNIVSPTNLAGRYKIGAVPSQTKLVFATSFTNAATGIEYFIDKDLSKTEQAEVMAAYASSIGSRRMVMTWPDIVKIPVGATIRPLPGFFFNPCVGALTTGLPTQQGFTNLSVALFNEPVHSSKYFDRDQLNALASGGVMIFVQDVQGVSALYIRHQLTTDRSAVKFQEYSVTKNVDFIAKFIRVNHKQFIGKYNIVEGAFDDLKTNAQSLMTYLRDSTKLPKIGGVIKSGKLIKLEQSTTNIDTVIERYKLDIPIPLNNLDITIVV